ncbi:ATP-binding protein [Gluconacetobacter sacchari]|uniref:histidine kinase n=2 Tax=Gluconacetobacter sacchari TaxID=92759 RepID=A0A7W4NL36_9PROT|nr:ATP-binding protein [Gluconacetobacter sacchari]MBB2159764.1 HAMP domain-containing protein [Gluconacetobacter sacchari]GBQ23490.1 two component sensor histidine kinase [Gluconacetobacter sacchari DSM 12717]
MLRRFRPRSLAARTSLLLIVGLGIIEAIGLAVHALDRIDFDRRMIQQESQNHVGMIYRSIVETQPQDREAELLALHPPATFHIALTPGPDPDMVEQAASDPLARLRMGHPPFAPPPFAHPSQNLPPLPPHMRPRQVLFSAPHGSPRRAVAFLLPDETRWLTIRYVLPSPNPFRSPTFPTAFALMTVAGGILIVWGVRRLVAPVGTLAAAAEALGRDVNAPPMSEDGPLEIARAAQAFNTMASRIRRFVTDRTLMLTAIGHDLRTPITRLKLRAEFVEDDELRGKFLADLDELESMVAATLAFGRDTSRREPMGRLDLTALLQTILDEAAETHPDQAEAIGFSTPPPAVAIAARPVALKRALNNLVQNAILYGGGARVTLQAPQPEHEGERLTTILIEDDGPGLPPEDLTRMFEPFVRAEASRNRETGGTGLGLAIARNIIWGLGGDIRLGNRTPHGLRATVTLVC